MLVVSDDVGDHYQHHHQKPNEDSGQTSVVSPLALLAGGLHLYLQHGDDDNPGQNHHIAHSTTS